MFRRDLFIGAGATLSLACLPAPARAERPRMTAYRAPSCGCCLSWVQHMRRAGFDVRVVDLQRLDPVQRGAGVPPELEGCHVAMLGPYSFSGHVPAAAVRRFLADPGTWRGLAVPGMPPGSPGMEVGGRDPQTYEVYAYGQDGRHGVFARARGGDLV